MLAALQARAIETWMTTLFLCGITVMLAIGCSSEPPEQTGEAEGFALLQHDESTLEATYGSGAASVRPLVDETEANVVDVTYDFGDSVVAFHIDHNRGVGDFMPGGSPLDAAQAQLIAPLLEGISKVMPPDAERTRVEDAAMRQTSFMQIVRSARPSRRTSSSRSATGESRHAQAAHRGRGFVGTSRLLPLRTRERDAPVAAGDVLVTHLLGAFRTPPQEAGATPMRVNLADLRKFPRRSGVPTEIAYPAEPGRSAVS